MIVTAGPRGNQTEDDYLIGQIYNLKKGSNYEKKMAELIIMMQMLHEIDSVSPWSLKEKSPKKPGYSLTTSVYNLSESVHKDLETHDYGRMPFSPFVFPVIDSLTVLGNLNGARAGFSLDFYTKAIKPTQTIAFIMGAPPKVLREAADSVFQFQDVKGGNAYHSNGEVKGRVIDLTRFGLEGKFRGTAVEGELIFGNKEGKMHNEVMTKMVENYEGLEGFKPNKFAIRHYNFGISPSVGEPKWKNGFKGLMKRVYRVLEEKAEKYAA